jgi:dipeptidase E
METSPLQRLLLISSSRTHGSAYLDHCEAEILDFLGDIRRVLFVPFAVGDWAGYAGRVRERMGKMGIEVDSLHAMDSPRLAVSQATSLFIGGGNTFRLLDALYRGDLLDPIRERVAQGMPYFGVSAGSNVACATIKTTNDMPIVQPTGFAALALVPFNINPHYLDPDPSSRHMGETREERIREFHELNDPPVVGLREGSMLRIDGKRVLLRGSAGARLFVRGEQARDLVPGSSLDFLLGAPR